MIVAIVVMMIGLFTTWAFCTGVVTNSLLDVLGQMTFMIGALVAALIWDNMKQRIKKLEDKEAKKDDKN